MSNTMTYSILTGSRSTDGSIKNWINSAVIPATAILEEAEAEIYNRLRVREMLTLVEGTLNTDGFRIAVPDGYRAAYSLRFVGSKKATLTKRELYDLEENYQYNADSTRASGKPQDYAADANYIWFDKVANEAYSYELRYYQALDALAEATNESNFLTDRYPYILRAACLAKGFEWLRNTSQESKYLSLMEKRIFEANSESDYEMIGADLQMQVG